MKTTTPLNYRIYGQGKPVVFLHGFLESLDMWKVLDLEAFPFQSILIDLPGHGGSPELPETISIAAMAEVVLQTLKQLKIESFGVAGHSMGGYVALQMAKTHRGIEKVCLVNSSFWADSAQKKEDRNRVNKIVKVNKDKFLKEAIPGLFATPEAHTAFIKVCLEIASQMTSEAIVYATSAMRDREDSEAVCDQLSKNLKIIQGEVDKSIPLKDMLSKTRDKDYPLVVLENVAHMSHVEATEEVKLILTDFFN